MGRLIAKILAWLAILLGLALLIQPTAAQWWTSTRNAKTAAQFAARGCSRTAVASSICRPCSRAR